MEDCFRSFVAVLAGPEIQRTLREVEVKLRQTGAHVGWVSPDNIHLTFSFLGDMPAGRTAEVANELDAVARAEAPFEINVVGIGWFGKSRPKVIWAGVTGPGVGPLVRIQKQVAERLFSLGFQLDERPFHPHFTLGRVRTARGAQDLLAAAQTMRETAFGSAEVRSIFLMRSELLPQGPRYSVLHEAPLRG